MISKGQADGPSGVTVNLMKEGTTTVLQTTTTGEGGTYTFSRVMPGDYSVQAASTGYKFSQVSLPVTRSHRYVNKLQVLMGKSTGFKFSQVSLPATRSPGTSTSYRFSWASQQASSSRR